MPTKDAKLIAFIAEHLGVLCEHLAATTSQLEIVNAQAMETVRDFSAVSDEVKVASETMIEDTYLAPNQDVRSVVNHAQKSADSYFDSQAREGDILQNDQSRGVSIGAENRVPIISSVFSKQLEEMSRFDDETRQMVLSIVGELSNGDVMKQRLEQIICALDFMKEKLKVVASQTGHHFDVVTVETIKEAVLEEVYRHYVVEVDKLEFKLIFGAPPHIVKAYQRRLLA